MALVVLLRGVNVGGHRTFRPSLLAQELSRLDVVNIGAAGTFVVRKPVRQAWLRQELARLLPFDTEVMICTGAEVLRLVHSDPMGVAQHARDVIPFVNVLAKRSEPSRPLPVRFPESGEWALEVTGQQGRFVYGAYRREMRAITSLAQIDRLYGVATTNRNWNTMQTIARVLAAKPTRAAGSSARRGGR